MPKLISKIFNKKLCLFKDAEGSEILFDVCDYIGREVMRHGSFEPKTIELITNLLEKGGTFVDVGANIGLYTCKMSRMENVISYAIEPFPKALNALISNLERNNSKAVVICTAVGASSTYSRISTPVDDNLGTTRLSNVDNNDLQISVPVDQLENVLKQNGATSIEVLKIDVEGLELEVLQGIDFSGSRRPKNIILEHAEGTASEAKLSKTRDLLKNFGYQLYTIENLPFTCIGNLPEDNLWCR